MEKIINHSRFIYFVTDIGTAQRLIAFNDTQNFIYKKSSLNTLSFTSADAKKELRTYCIENIPNSGNVFEFGVYKGNSISFFANFLKEKEDDRIIYGFDSFSGFSEEWSGLNEKYNKNFFALDSELPKVPRNTKLINGFIENSLPKFLKKNKIKSVAFIHIDTDTYSPAKVVLKNLKPFMKSGTIILFDELCGYPNWRSHEYRALTEVFKDNEYEFLGFASHSNRATLVMAGIRIL